MTYDHNYCVMCGKSPCKCAPIVDLPVCPFCNSTMRVVDYRGYYEDFPYWECDCDAEKLVKHKSYTEYGSYV